MLTDIRFATVFREGMLNGQFFPGWAGDNFGFGSIGVRFYPPIAFYALAIAEMITGDWFSALWLTLLFWMVAGCAGVYLFVKEFSTPAQGLIAGIAYAVVPQHLNEIFQFFLFAEFAAWGVLPFCFWFLTRVCRGGSWSDTILFALAYSVLILTHIPTTIIASFCFPIYALALMDPRKIKPIFIKLGTAIAITITATSFRWVNIVWEYEWLSHNSDKWANGYYQYSAWLFPNTFQERGLFIYVLTSWLFDISILMTIALTFPALIYLFKKRNERGEIVWRVLLAAVVTAWFAFFMLSQPSKFIWDSLGFLQKIQFPWRWLSVLSMLSVTAFALALPKLLVLFRSRERLFAYPALALVFAIILFDLTQIIIPSDPIPRAKFHEVHKKLATEPIFEGWWPVWAKHEALDMPHLPVANGRLVEPIVDGSSDKTFAIREGEATIASVPTFYYPHWKATVNDKPVWVNPDANGLITFPIGDERSIVRISFEEPLRNVMASWLSTAAWMLMALLLVRAKVSQPLRFSKRFRIPKEGYDFS